MLGNCFGTPINSASYQPCPFGLVSRVLDHSDRFINVIRVATFHFWPMHIKITVVNCISRKGSPYASLQWDQEFLRDALSAGSECAQTNMAILEGKQPEEPP